MSHTTNPFAERRRILTVRQDAFALAGRIRAALGPNDEAKLQAILCEFHPADLADAMLHLSQGEEQRVFSLLGVAEAAEVLDEVNAATEACLVRITPPDRLAHILDALPADEGADVVGKLTTAEAEKVLASTSANKAADIRTLLGYKPNTAGGIMSLGFVDVPDTATQAEALQRFQQKTEAEHIFFVYVVNAQNGLQGVVNLRQLLAAPPDTPVRDLMHHDFVSVPPETDQEQVAQVFARYDLTALAVVGPQPDCKLLGVVTADDVIDVIQEEADEDVAHLTGSDAVELEKKSPVQVAKLRLPWIMATLGIELVASLVIHVFDKTLIKYVLLASFMPVISAISGNTGLQSAAIIIRGLSSGQVQLSHWKNALARQMATTAILGGTCAGTLGIIGGIWDKHWAFGLVVFLGMFMSVNIAGVVGTVVPLISKRAGFDPALTAGPFETAFQDVVGISIFLSLASVLLNVLR